MAKKKETAGDKVLRILSILGGLTCLVTVIPAVPWRYAKINTNLGARFSQDRSISMFTISNQNRASMGWLSMSKKVCQKSNEFVKGSPMAAMGGFLMNAGASAVGASDYTGGAMVGCAGWDKCKSHVQQRCMSYQAMAYTGIFTMLLQLIGAICAFVVPVMQGQEASAGKKKKKQDAAKQSTMFVSVAAFVNVFLASLTWFALSTIQFQALQSSSFYPWPAAFVGCYLALIGNIFLLIGMIIAIRRTAAEKKKDDDDEEGEADEYAAAGGLPPDPAADAVPDAAPEGGLPPDPAAEEEEKK